MTAEVVARSLDGRPVADRVAAEVGERVAGMPVPPRLVFVRVGEDPASASYVRSKERLASKVGIRAETIVFPEGTGRDELLTTVDRLNEDDDVDGILVQLPLPGLRADEVLGRIDPGKDVDGLHPVNVGRLWGGSEAMAPCTPLGLLAICDHYGIALTGQRVVIVGRSNLVGKPAAALFLGRDATVTLAHSRTRDLGAVVRTGDVVVAAVGRAALIDGTMVAPGATVLDVGVSRVGDRIVGDVAPDVWNVAGAVTPMPRGTGPVTVAMVIANTLTAAMRRRGLT